MLSPELLEILRCPNCAPEGREGALDLIEDSWLVCHDCGRKYPILDDLPYMLVEVGDQWIDTPADELPIPPPEPDLCGPVEAPADEPALNMDDRELQRQTGLPRWVLLIPLVVGLVVLIRWIAGRSSCCQDGEG